MNDDRPLTKEEEEAKRLRVLARDPAALWRAQQAAMSALDAMLPYEKRRNRPRWKEQEWSTPPQEK